jgi:hypothetical protein
MALTKIPTHMLFSGAASEDLSIDSDTLFIDASANRVGIANNSPSVALDVTGALTVSGAITGTLATAAQTNITSLGTLSSLAVGAITSTASSTITTADNTDTLSLISTDADGNSGPNLRMYRNSGSPVDGDMLGAIEFEGRNDNSQDVVYAELFGETYDVSDGTEDGRFFIKTMVGGTRTHRMYMNFNETNFNEGGADIDFRVESDGNANMLFVDAGNDRVGIGTASPSRQLTVSSSGQTDLAIVAGTSASAQLQFGDSGDDNIGQIEYNNSTNNMVFYASATEHMRINSNGNINIGIGGSGGDLILQPLAKLYLDAGGNTYIQESAGDVIDIYTGGTRRLRINSNGLIFNADTASANALDDYEEGTFTPTYTVAGGGSAGTVTSTNVGTYTKVGNIVHCAVRSFYVPTSGTVPTAYNITLPFQATNNSGLAGSGSGREIAQTGVDLEILIDGNATTGVIKATNGASPPANAYIDLSFTYQSA